MTENTLYNERYDNLIGYEFKNDKPFARTEIIEFDSSKGKRITSLDAKLDRINFEECIAVELLTKDEVKELLKRKIN